jgi:hypothetical protein
VEEAHSAAVDHYVEEAHSVPADHCAAVDRYVEEDHSAVGDHFAVGNHFAVGDHCVAVAHTVAEAGRYAVGVQRDVRAVRCAREGRDVQAVHNVAVAPNEVVRSVARSVLCAAGAFHLDRV